MVTNLVGTPDDRFDVMALACPTRSVIDRIGDRWTLLVLYALGGGPQRFTRLRAQVEGISQKMLTQTVRGMERDGLLTRTVHAEVPPRVEYELTALGVSLQAVVAEIRHWAYRHMDEIDAARAHYDARDRSPT